MKVGDLVKLKETTINCIDELKDALGLVIHSEEVDPNECEDKTCNYLVYVKWAGIGNGLIEGKYWIYHDIDLDVVGGQ